MQGRGPIADAPGRHGLGARQPGLRLALAAACLVTAAAALALEGKVRDHGPQPETGCGEARGRAALAADLIAIARLRDPRGLASHLAYGRDRR